jgi:hypothetical protein
MFRLPLFAALLVAAAGCGHHHHSEPESQPEEDRFVSIEVEVYDPVTNLVWEGVSVRVVEAWQEWCGCIYVNPAEVWFLTDASGRVFLDEVTLGDARVGFLEDGDGCAVLSPFFDEDEATVLLEIAATGFTPVFIEVSLRWDQPDVFVEVPFN